MFQVTLSELMVVYLLLVLGGLFLLWFLAEIYRMRRASMRRRFQLRCQVCQYHYEDRSEEPYPECPQCGRPNERIPVSEI